MAQMIAIPEANQGADLRSGSAKPAIRGVKHTRSTLTNTRPPLRKPARQVGTGNEGNVRGPLPVQSFIFPVLPFSFADLYLEIQKVFRGKCLPRTVNRRSTSHGRPSRTAASPYC